MNDDLFERAFQAGDIEAVAGVKLYPAGRQRRGECPLCGASKGKKSGGAFSADPRAKVFKCFACGAGGDVVKLEHLLNSRVGEGLRDAAARLAGDAFAPRYRPEACLSEGYVPAQGFAANKPARPRRAVRETGPDDDGAWKIKVASQLWREARSARGTLVEVYLRVRGITGSVLDQALSLLRFHPAAYHSGPPDRPRLAPAAIGLVMAIGPAGTAMATGGVHVTYLAADGRGKSALEPAKRMWGPQGWTRADGVTRPGGVWLTRPDAGGPLIVAEGIESALSAAILSEIEGKGSCRVVATLSLGALQGGWASDQYGRVNADMPKGDPEKLAFTWPEPSDAPWGEVRICVDRDMSEIRVRCRKAGGGTWKRPLDGEARARICAGLAEQAWRAAGANAVRIWAPAPGRDFNDELRARIATGGGVG